MIVEGPDRIANVRSEFDPANASISASRFLVCTKLQCSAPGDACSGSLSSSEIVRLAVAVAMLQPTEDPACMQRCSESLTTEGIKFSVVVGLAIRLEAVDSMGDEAAEVSVHAMFGELSLVAVGRTQSTRSSISED